ncbi:MAG: Flp/Fap pilin component [Clostridia bacterium]|nr:Flp/Fap pilin component [Clostridia bacterium]
MDLIKKLFIEEEGQGMAEYALIIGLVAVLLIGTLTVFKDKVADLFKSLNQELSNPTS